MHQNNIKIKGSVEGDVPFVFGNINDKFDSPSTYSDFSNTDFILYYEVLDNDLVSIDIGLNGKSIDGSIEVSGLDSGISRTKTLPFDGVVPLLYGAAEVGLPFTGLAFYGDMSYLKVDGHQLSDYQVGIAYDLVDNIAFDIAVQLGYRSFSLTLDDLDDINSDLDVKGAYLGLEIHF